jgi:peptidoglycan hydrolase FlgJ
MTRISTPQTIAPAVPASEDAKLRRAAQELEGVFVQELFKAMRETVPEGGIVDGGPGEDMFSSMMDQTISSEAASGWERGLGAALYRQLRPMLSGAPVPSGTEAAPQQDAAAEGSH